MRSDLGQPFCMSYRPSITHKNEVELRYGLAGAVSEAPCEHDEDVSSIRGVISQTDRVQESVQALLKHLSSSFSLSEELPHVDVPVFSHTSHIYSYCASGQLLRVTSEAVSSH